MSMRVLLGPMAGHIIHVHTLGLKFIATPISLMHMCYYEVADMIIPQNTFSLCNVKCGLMCSVCWFPILVPNTLGPG